MEDNKINKLNKFILKDILKNNDIYSFFLLKSYSEMYDIDFQLQNITNKYKFIFEFQNAEEFYFTFIHPITKYKTDKISIKELDLEKNKLLSKFNLGSDLIQLEKTRKIKSELTRDIFIELKKDLDQLKYPIKFSQFSTLV